MDLCDICAKVDRIVRSFSRMQNLVVWSDSGCRNEAAKCTKQRVRSKKGQKLCPGMYNNESVWIVYDIIGYCFIKFRTSKMPEAGYLNSRRQVFYCRIPIH